MNEKPRSISEVEVVEMCGDLSHRRKVGISRKQILNLQHRVVVLSFLKINPDVPTSRNFKFLAIQPEMRSAASPDKEQIFPDNAARLILLDDE